MEKSPSQYDPPFSSYAKISWENVGQSYRKWCHQYFDGGFEFGDFENPHNQSFHQIERIR